MQSAKDAREARRRKILERGADRLAFITGELKRVPKPFEPPVSSPVEPSANGVDRGQVCVGAINAGASEESSISRLTEIHDEISSAEVANMNGQAIVSEPLEADARATDDSTDFTVERNSFPLRSTCSSSVAHQTGYKKLPSSTSPRLFTINRFRHSIDASENARILCAVGIAVFLISQSARLSHNDLAGAPLKSFVPLWPVCLILVTDIMLVLGTMLLTSEDSNMEDDICPSSEEAQSSSHIWYLANKVGSALEAALVLRKVVSAISIDCSIYVVVLICGLSLARYWF